MNLSFNKYLHRYNLANGCKLFVRLAVLSVFYCLASCTSSKNIRYFSNISDSSIVKLPDFNKPQALIMVDDILEIKIAGANETTSALLNTYSSTSNPANASTYLVDNNGQIEFPLIGKVAAAGLTKEQFKDALKEKVMKYLKDPLISVKFMNFRFTVLGEVRTPGTYNVANEKVTILEAMGLAGDLTNYAKRSNVRVIRDSLGKREIGMVNFNDKAIFTSPFYYLQRNDVVYIEPEKYKTKFEDFSRVTSVIATLASLIAIAITVFRHN